MLVEVQDVPYDRLVVHSVELLHVEHTVAPAHEPTERVALRGTLGQVEARYDPRVRRRCRIRREFVIVKEAVVGTV